MNSKLVCKVIQRVKRMGGIEVLLILAVAVLHFTVMSQSIRANRFMPDAQLFSRFFKQRWQIAFAVGKTVRKLKPVAHLNVLHPDTAARIPRRQSAEE